MLAQFTLQLIAGISLMWVLMPRRLVTSGFFRIQMLLVLGLSVLATLSAGQLTRRLGAEEIESVTAATPATFLTPLGILTMSLAGIAFIGSVLWTLERRKGGGICAFLIWGLSNLALDWAFRGRLDPNWLGLLSAGSSASVLGGAVTSMLLGHWYLTAPTMSISPLTRLTTILGISLVVRLVISAIGWSYSATELQGSLLWTWFALRWLAGIVAPLVLCGMTLRILRYRNTQAATGVLFATVILTFIGEMSAALLSSELQHPF